MGKKNKELINNITQTISKELKKSNGGNKKLVETLQKILDKASWPKYDLKKKLIIYLITIVLGLGIFFYAQEFGFNFDGVTGIGLLLLMFLFSVFCIWGIINQ